MTNNVVAIIGKNANGILDVRSQHFLALPLMGVIPNPDTRPRLPSAARVLPYMPEIDDNAWWSSTSVPWRRCAAASACRSIPIGCPFRTGRYRRPASTSPAAIRAMPAPW